MFGIVCAVFLFSVDSNWRWSQSPKVLVQGPDYSHEHRTLCLRELSGCVVLAGWPVLQCMLNKCPSMTGARPPMWIVVMGVITHIVSHDTNSLPQTHWPNQTQDWTLAKWEPQNQNTGQTRLKSPLFAPTHMYSSDHQTTHTLESIRDKSSLGLTLGFRCRANPL